MKVIGITGGIASGKSLATAFLSRRFSVPVIDADAITHALLAADGRGVAPVVKAFGGDYQDEKGAINRQRLGQLVFANPQARKKLNKILHPLIRNEIEQRTAALKKKKIPVVLVSAALILEEQLESHYDDLMIVLTAPELQIERLIKQRQFSEANAKLRIAAQWDNTRREKANYFKVYNRESEKKFESALERTWLELAMKHHFSTSR